MTKEQLPTEYDAENPNDLGNEFGDEDYDADNNISDVATSKTNKIVGFLILGVLIIAVLMFLFSGEDEEKIAEEKKNNVEVYNPTSTVNGASFNVAPVPEEEITPIFDNISPEEEVISDVVNLEVPDLPELNVAELPATEEFNIAPSFSDDDIFSGLEDNNQNALDIEEGKSDDILSLPEEPSFEGPSAGGRGNNGEATSMMLMNGGNINLNNDSVQIENSSAANVSATKIEFPERTIAQGKLIDSVLETAVNTDLEGKVRAIVSRDVYADFGKKILIPKGSRLIGSYSGTTARGQTRVLMTWERLIRPDAIDIMINSTASDQFGRSGVPGAVDNKYLELFNNSILLSLITVGTALAIESSTNSEGVKEEEDSNGDTSTIASPSDLAAQEIINNISENAKTVLEGILNVNPTITIPHGTRIKVFVNQDLIFPETQYGAFNNNDNVIFIK